MKLYPLIFLCLIMVSAATVSAEEVADTVELEAITVTAIKADPVAGSAAVTTINASEAARLHVESVKGAADIAPNFFVPDYGSRITSSIYVRGIGARIDQPAVGLLVDNVPFMNKDAYDFDLPDIKSLKIIRGPQSTLYGRNTMAGVIDITTLSPFDYQGLRVSAQYGRANTWKAGAGYYVLLNDRAGISASVRAGGSDGFFTNSYTGKKCDYETSVGGRLKFHWSPSHTFTLLNTFAASYLRQGGYPYEYVETGDIAYNDTCSYRRLCINDGLTLRLHLGEVTLSSVTSWQYIDDSMRLDQDFLPQDYFTLIQSKREHAFTQDFIARGDVQGKYQWLTGLFGFYKNLDMNAPVTFQDTGISELIEFYRNNANPYYPIRWSERKFTLNSDFVNASYGVAVYHNSSLKLGRWTLGAALRLDYERASLSYHSHTATQYEMLYRETVDAVPQHYRDVPVLIDEQGGLHRSFLQLLPKISATYDFLIPVGWISPYLSMAKGYKSGGYNTQMFSDVLQQQLMWQMGIGMRYDVDDIVSYRPEKSWNFEAGVKFMSNDGRISAEVTAFLIQVFDQQLTMFPDGNTTGRIMTNAGRTRSRGVEVSARWMLIENLCLSGAYGFTHATFRDFFDGKQQYRGNRVPYAPANTLFISADYSLPLANNNRLIFNVNMRGNGEIYWNEANTRVQPFYALLGASAAFQHPKFSIELWGANLTSTRYHTFYFVSMSHEFMQRGRPLECGVTVNLNI